MHARMTLHDVRPCSVALSAALTCSVLYFNACCMAARRLLQVFDVRTTSWSKFLLIHFKTHYGTESACTVNTLRVLGTTEAEDLEAQLSALEADLTAPEDAPSATAQPPPSAASKANAATAAAASKDTSLADSSETPASKSKQRDQARRTSTKAPAQPVADATTRPPAKSRV